MKSYHWRVHVRGVDANFAILLGKWVGAAQEVAVLSDYFHIRIIFLTVGAQGDHLHHSRCEENRAKSRKFKTEVTLRAPCVSTDFQGLN